MRFNYLDKLEDYNRFTKDRSGVDSSKKGVGSYSRQRTKQYIGLGQASAEDTKYGMQSAAQGVRRMFKQSDIEKARADSQDTELEMAAWIDSIESERKENAPEVEKETYDALKLSEELYGKKGVQAGKPAANSYFNTPIIEGGLRGNSRKAGDVSPEVQQQIVNMIVETGSSLDMTDYEIAYALATARFESGFNPDAAAKTTSAKGVGQFVDKTGEAYNLTADNQWDASAQVQALLEHTIDNFEMARKKGYSNEYVYALHHDGPSLDRGGLGLSKQNIMPFVPKYLELIKKYRGEK